MNADIKNLSAELKGLNSVYLPRKIDNSTYRILFLKDKLSEAVITFALYNGKRRIRSFRDQALTAFPYDEATNRYVLSKGTVQLYFPKLKVYNVVLKVNGDKYRIAPKKNKYEFTYLNRQTENILVDFSIYDSKGRVTQYKNQPLDSIPGDENGYRVIDKKFLKALKQMGVIARM